jgi:8-oxo-dGTP diphosphatase
MTRSAIVRGAFSTLKEILRHTLRRPVVGVAAAARTADDHWLLVRRADTGQWGLAGGTLAWGETLHECLAREMAEEAGVVRCDVLRIVAVLSRPERDPRFHGVTVVVECRVDPPVREPSNPLEIREVRLFKAADVPAELAMGMQDALHAAMSGKALPLE